MNRTSLHAMALPSLLGGTSRHPLPGNLLRVSNPNSDGGLEILSLMGQALSFQRPSTPDAFMVEPTVKDDRKIIADGLRRPLIRLLSSRNVTDHPARALARAFDRLRMRPHPFDLPLIDAFVRSSAEKLGPTAQHWADRQKPDAATQGFFDPELLDESNWTQATTSRRVAYLEQRRREDAGDARRLLESNWPQEEADARFRLLQVFQTGLSMADQQFLSSLEKDRAPRVRALAAKLLARLGAGGENPALRECRERIKESQSGLLRKRMTLQLELPANVRDQAASRWIFQTFNDVSFGQLADSFKITEQELIEAASKDEHLLLALALMATNERRLDLLEVVVSNLPNVWERMFEAGLDSLGTMTESERQRWEEIIVHPYRKDPPATYLLWDWLHRIADAQAPAPVMSIVLKAGLLNTIPEGERLAWFEVMTARCPVSQRQELRAQLANFDQSLCVTSLALLDILNGMENDRTHVRKS
ncbi:MAG TPA: DUF5691 domain-containing protein [Terriglobia bacterium]|nr:DUF5691 domain-containing protein [Terriglobia bacterium]